MAVLQPLPIANCHSQWIGIDIITALPTLENGHDCIVTFVDHKTNRAQWCACKKSIDTSASVRIFIDNIVHLHGVLQKVVLDRDVGFTADYWRDVATIL